jgi:GNAT superfamily N-acetyltransferase
VADTVESVLYADLAVSVRREIAILQDRAYRPHDRSPSQLVPLHDPALQAQSFLLRCDGRLVSYAGVVTTTIHANGMDFTASGLSCVATDPDFAGRGFASQVVAAASRYITRSGVDLGVFTCAPELARLYTEAGGWEVVPDAVVIGSCDLQALTSTALGVAVLMQLLSHHALAHSDASRVARIDLGLPAGQFW